MGDEQNMSNILILNQPYVTVGLGTETFTIPSTGIYNVSLQSTELPASALSIVVNKNAAPVFTAPTLSPTQSAIQFKTNIVCAINDVITVVLSSGNANDNLLNSVKTNMFIGNGAL